MIDELARVTDLHRAGIAAQNSGHARRALRVLHRAAALGQGLPASAEAQRVQAAISISLAATIAEIN